MEETPCNPPLGPSGHYALWGPSQIRPCVPCPVLGSVCGGHHTCFPSLTHMGPASSREATCARRIPWRTDPLEGGDIISLLGTQSLEEGFPSRCPKNC